MFSDINRAVRIFGTAFSNRDQFNLAYFRQWEKDTNTALNTFNDRGQNLFFANYYRQNFLVPGYTAQVSLNYDNDPASIKYDKNRFLVRPDPVGNFQPHTVDVGYLGWAGDGHWGRYNLTHQFYWAFGHDSMNPLANRPQTINAQMFAIEGSYDRDWVRYRLSFFYASGDGNVNGSQATGFDTILDQPNFAGGGFSFWNRQQIALQGVNLTQRLSLVPDLRSSKIQGQANFVNPGLLLPTFGMDFELTPKLKLINNYNLIWFDKTSVLQTFLFQGNVNSFVGFDIGLGCEYRPLVSENIVFVAASRCFYPGRDSRTFTTTSTAKWVAWSRDSSTRSSRFDDNPADCRMRSWRTWPSATSSRSCRRVNHGLRQGFAGHQEVGNHVDHFRIRLVQGMVQLDRSAGLLRSLDDREPRAGRLRLEIGARHHRHNRARGDLQLEALGVTLVKFVK